MLLGLYVDYRFGFSPWGVIAGAALGLAIALYHLIRDVLKIKV